MLAGMSLQVQVPTEATRGHPVPGLERITSGHRVWLLTAGWVLGTKLVLWNSSMHLNHLSLCSSKRRHMTGFFFSPPPPPLLLS